MYLEEVVVLVKYDPRNQRTTYETRYNDEVIENYFSNSHILVFDESCLSYGGEPMNDTLRWIDLQVLPSYILNTINTVEISDNWVSAVKLIDYSIRHNLLPSLKTISFVGADDTFHTTEYGLEIVDFPKLALHRGRYEGLLRKRVEAILADVVLEDLKVIVEEDGVEVLFNCEFFEEEEGWIASALLRWNSEHMVLENLHFDED